MVVSGHAADQRHLRGHVYDQDGKPVAGADVKLEAWNVNYSCTTDGEGAYDIVAEGSDDNVSGWQVTVSAPGFIAFEDRYGMVALRGDSEMDFVLYSRVVYPKGKLSTIVLPIAPDASAGRYYRLYDTAGNTVVFLREQAPKANVPYLFYANEDYSVNVAGLDLSSEIVFQCSPGTRFLGGYTAHNIGEVTGNDEFVRLDETDDCRNQVGGLHAYLVTRWPYVTHATVQCLETVPEHPSYKPMLKDGRTWNYTGENGAFREFIDGETEMFGEVWKRVYIEQPLGSEPRLEKLMREQEDRVYVQGDNTILKMADFSIGEGEPFPSYQNLWHLEYTGQDSIVSQGRSYRRLHFDQRDMTGSAWPSVTWIEGISFGCGIYWSGMEGNLYEMRNNALDVTAVLQSCYDGDTCIFKADDVTALPVGENNVQEYYPEGTKWTEIRLDTLKYDSWYSQVGGEWLPNYETIEYYVKGEYVEKNVDDPFRYKEVYTNSPEWTDSLTLLLLEHVGAEYVGPNNVMVSVLRSDYEGNSVPWYPAMAYQYDWSEGEGLYYEDIVLANTTCIPFPRYFYGVIDEIKSGDFGGVRPLQYADLDGKAPESAPNDPIRNTDTQGGRMIQGIGMTEWNDGECLFGPSRLYDASGLGLQGRHYRSMLVHFERNGEVLYDVWPMKAASGIKSMNTEKTLFGNALYDLQGRPVAHPAKGIYIQNGKERVVK